MTMTPADWAALQAAGAAGGTNYLEALNAQNQQIAASQASMLAGIPGAQTGGVPGAPATSGQYTVGADAIAAVQADYPNLAWLLAIPELAPLIVHAAQTGMDPTAFQAQFESTNWYRTNSESVRNWIAEVETDPAKAQSDMAAQQNSVSTTLAQLGVTYQASQLTMLAQQSLAMGWTDQQLKDQITNALRPNPDGTFTFTYGGIGVPESNGPGTLPATINQIQGEAAKFLVPISQSTAQSFALAMSTGNMDTAALDAYMQNQAASLYPSIAGAIKSGITPADYVTPYKEVAAQLLGVSPNTINMTDPKYNVAITQPGPDGKPVAMSLYAWQQHLMQNSQYGYMRSVNAQDRASSLVQGLGEMFGKSPSGPAGSTAFTAAGAPRIQGVPIT